MVDLGVGGVEKCGQVGSNRPMRWSACILVTAVVLGCGAKKQQSGPAWNEPEPEYKDHYEPMTEPVVLQPVEAPPAGEVGQIEKKWTLCAKDSECTVVETECCGYLAVNREYWDEARAQLPYSACDMLCPTNVATACVDGVCEVQM